MLLSVRMDAVSYTHLELCTTFFDVFTMLCAMLDGCITAHCALALPTANRHRQIISVILVLMLLWILVDFIIYCSPRCV